MKTETETLLLHLLRGAGLDGLGGMRWATELNTNSFATSSGGEGRDAYGPAVAQRAAQ